MKKPKALTLKTLSKSNVWDLQENDVFRLLATAEKDADLKDNFRRYVDIFRSAFEIETVAVDRPQVIEKYEARGFQVDSVADGDSIAKWAVKKRPIMRIQTSHTKTFTTFLLQNLLKCWNEISEVAGSRFRRAFRILSRADLT